MALVSNYISQLLFWITITFFFLLLINKIYINKKGTTLKILLIAYIVGICSQTIFPAIDFGIDSVTNVPYFNIQFQEKNMRGLNLIPFKSILNEITGNIPQVDSVDRCLVGIVNFAGPISLFIPLGFLLPFVAERYNHFKNVFVFSLTLSCFIEFLQFFIGRSTDVDDIILNMLGSCIGYWIWTKKNRLLSKAK